MAGRQIVVWTLTREKAIIWQELVKNWQIYPGLSLGSQSGFLLATDPFGATNHYGHRLKMTFFTGIGGELVVDKGEELTI